KITPERRIRIAAELLDDHHVEAVADDQRDAYAGGLRQLAHQGLGDSPHRQGAQSTVSQGETRKSRPVFAEALVIVQEPQASERVGQSRDRGLWQPCD